MSFATKKKNENTITKLDNKYGIEETQPDNYSHRKGS